MAYFKLCIAVVALFVASCAGTAIDKRLTDINNIDQCDPTTAKVRLLQTNLYEPKKLLLPVTRTLTYPDNGLNTHLITCLKVIDMDTGNHGGHPEILSGGVGAYDVQIRLTSQWGQPLNFRIEIWADEDKEEDDDEEEEGDGLGDSH